MKNFTLLIETWELNKMLELAIHTRLPHLEIEESEWGDQYVMVQLSDFRTEYPILREVLEAHELEVNVMNVEVLYQGAYKKLYGKMGDEIGTNQTDEYPIVALRYNGVNGEANGDRTTEQGSMNYCILDAVKFDQAERKTEGHSRVETY